MKYKLYVQNTAKIDAKEIYAWLRKHSTSGADNWFNAYQEALYSLEANPLVNKLVRESIFSVYEIRDCLFKTKKGLKYRILYTILNDEVRVLRVRSPYQDLLNEKIKIGDE